MGREKAGEKSVSDDFAERRASARARLDALDPHKTPGGVAADPLRRGWFEAVYALAERDPGRRALGQSRAASAAARSGFANTVR